MTLTVVWHKRCWRDSRSPSGFAARGCLGHPGFGGLPVQVEALAPLFDAVRIVGPCGGPADPWGELPVTGERLSVVPLRWLPRSPWRTWLALPLWLALSGSRLVREVSRADAVLAFVPSPIGLLGVALSVLMRKPLLVRPVTGWSDVSPFWRLERSILERLTGGRRIMVAPGNSPDPPSACHPEVRWLLGTSVSRHDVPDDPKQTRGRGCRSVRLIVVSQDIDAREVMVVLEALSILAARFDDVAVDVVGGGAPAILERAAVEATAGRVTLHGPVTRARLRTLMGAADALCALPTRETESFRQAVHEALATGLPVVLSDSSLTGAVIRDGFGVLLRERSPRALADAVVACLADPERYAQMSEAALRAARQYAVEAWVDEMRRVLTAAWGPLQTGSASVAGCPS